jgi:AraC family transcriptional regulator of adaptative response/methylated-DNA-[protein]-cysteine methyltransferase
MNGLDTQTPSQKHEYHAALVGQVARYIQENPEKPTLAEIGAQVNMSPFHLQRIFKQATGMSPREYAEVCRLKRFKMMLRQARERDDGTTITAAMYDAGFGSSSRLYERTHAQLGMTPGAYRDGGYGMMIGYVIQQTPMGRLLVAMTERGVCAVCLGDDDLTLERELYAEYPAASIHRNQDVVCEWVHEILDYLNGWRPNLSLPTDVKATAFQRKVWNALQEIPYGETRTYQEFAAQIGAPPDAIPDLARAIAENPTPLLIPCHRVIRTEPNAGGFRWGDDWQTALLDQEHTISEHHQD